MFSWRVDRISTPGTIGALVLQSGEVRNPKIYDFNPDVLYNQEQSTKHHASRNLLVVA